MIDKYCRFGFLNDTAMSNASIPISIRVQKSKSKMFKEFLKSLDYVEFEDEDYRGFSRESFIPGDKTHIKDAFESIKGIREGEKTDYNKLRKEAWRRGERRS
jgi:hypothetical protein